MPNYLGHLRSFASAHDARWKPCFRHVVCNDPTLSAQLAWHAPWQECGVVIGGVSQRQFPKQPDEILVRVNAASMRLGVAVNSSFEWERQGCRCVRRSQGNQERREIGRQSTEACLSAAQATPLLALGKGITRAGCPAPRWAS